MAANPTLSQRIKSGKIETQTPVVQSPQPPPATARLHQSREREAPPKVGARALVADLEEPTPDSVSPP
ncbi:unnamed protein product [Linum trigynum]|uniref:Uncharacterized protein n=1 Tax=Linum trigynum TaxID=586398 RepID=A0AAV2G830_9ROSI